MVWTEDTSLHHSDSDVRGAAGNGPIHCVPALFSIPSSSRLAAYSPLTRQTRSVRPAFALAVPSAGPAVPPVTPLLTAFRLCSVRPPRPLTCFCDLMSQHLHPLGFFFFFPVVNLLCLLGFNMLVTCGPLWNAFAL